MFKLVTVAALLAGPLVSQDVGRTFPPVAIETKFGKLVIERLTLFREGLSGTPIPRLRFFIRNLTTRDWADATFRLILKRSDNSDLVEDHLDVTVPRVPSHTLLRSLGISGIDPSLKSTRSKFILLMVRTGPLSRSSGRHANGRRRGRLRSRLLSPALSRSARTPGGLFSATSVCSRPRS